MKNVYLQPQEPTKTCLEEFDPKLSQIWSFWKWVLKQIMQTNFFQYLWFIPLWIISKMKISHKVTNFAHNLFINQEETMKLYSVFPIRATKLSFQVISRTFIAPFILLLDHAWLSAKQSSLETKKKIGQL